MRGSMNIEAIDGYEELVDALGVLPETAKRALALSIETAMRHFFQASDCLVDMDSMTANIVFRMPQHRRVIERLDLAAEVLDHDILPVTFSLASLPEPVQKTARPLFIRILERMKAEDEYVIWKNQVGQVIEGVIRKRYADCVQVDLNGATGTLKRCAWVFSEEPIYRTGNVMHFYISSVKHRLSGITIALSRSSKKLPALLLKSYLPMHRFVCSRRFIGQKSIIYTDAPCRDKDIVRIREKVRRELNGEILEMRSFP